MSTYRTYRHISELQAMRRSEPVRQLREVQQHNDTHMPSQEFLMLQQATEEKAPGGFFVMLGGAALAGLALWAFFVLVLGV